MATLPTHLVGLNPNWVEDLLRKENSTIEDVWVSTFSRDFRKWLNVDDANGFGKFNRELIDSWALTDLRMLEINLAQFRQYIESERVRRWEAAQTSAGSGAPQESLPPPTPFNSASAFLEFYFIKLIPVLKISLVEHIQAFLESEIGRNATSHLDPEKVQAMASLSANEGCETSFDLVAIHPLSNRSVRSLRAEDCGQVVALTGTVTRCSEVRPELRTGAFECSACGTVQENVEQNFKLTEPAFCIKAGCGNRSKWIIKLEASLFADWQKLRLQQGEAEDIPAGTVPRTIDVIARSSAVEACKPGDKIIATGCLLAVPDVPSLMRPGELPSKMNQDRNRALRSETGASDATIKGLSKLGVRELAYKQVFLATHIQMKSSADNEDMVKNVDIATTVSPDTPAGRLIRQLMDIPSDNSAVIELIEHPLLRAFGLSIDKHRRFKKVAASLDSLDRLIKMVAPEIYGADDIKKGLLLMLVGGVEKRTRKDSIKLRGDINMCLVGDPGTAKSQLLKWVQMFADRAIFTSGKSSTAAGLTASVHKDAEQGNESVVEAGALILADNGICCIDEFDKMDPKDMVAIHEAMEQQTISISKAGMQATMNARASVLAACNPADGRYDVTKQLAENLKLSPTILSRFDLIFILLDRASEQEDTRVARHILEGLSGTGNVGRGAQLIDEEDLKCYVRLAKAFRPRLTQAAKAVLVRKYVAYRQRDTMAGQKRSMRLTVRQLESMVRIAEAIAKLNFSHTVEEEHAKQAVQIFGNCLTRVKTDTIVLIDDDADEEGQEPIIIQLDVFEAIQSHIVNYIRKIDEFNQLTPNNPQHTTYNQILDWFLNEFHSDLVDDEELDAERRRFRLIIQRMLLNGVIFEESLSMESELIVIKVHPNLGDPSLKHRRNHQTLPTDYFVTGPSTTGDTLARPQDTQTLNIPEGDFLAMVYPSDF